MFRYIFTVGPVTLFSYGALLAIAFIAGTRLAVSRARKRGIAPEAVYDLVFYIIASSIAGARLLFVALNAEYYLRNPLNVLKIWEGGLVLYGGVLSAFVVSILYLKKKQLPVWSFADIVAPSLALGFALGRIGCFLNGCCYGIVSESFGVRFPARQCPPAYYQQTAQGLIPPGSAHSLPVLPTQLYESAACLFILLVLLRTERAGAHFNGFLFWLFILLYSTARFLIEALRFYEPHFYFFGITVGQWASLFFACAALWVIATGTARARKI